MMALNAIFSHFLNIFWDRDSTTTLGYQFQCQINLSVEKFPLMSNLPWHSLRDWHWLPGRRSQSPPSYSLLLGVVKSNNVSAEPPLLQAKILMDV